jgi:hypothetical protein
MLTGRDSRWKERIILVYIETAFMLPFLFKYFEFLYAYAFVFEWHRTRNWRIGEHICVPRDKQANYYIFEKHKHWKYTYEQIDYHYSWARLLFIY